jgi:4-hydroxy-3-polyprenylbenzoate decarboxylase
MATPPSKRIIVGITGASGAIYAVRTVRALLLRGFEVHLVISKFGERLLADEANVALSKEGFVERILRETPRPAGLGCVVRHDVRDLGASISSGSFCTAGMVVVPCTTKTLAGIARGFSSNLIERAADVCHGRRDGGGWGDPSRLSRLLSEAGELRGSRRFHRGTGAQRSRTRAGPVHTVG